MTKLNVQSRRKRLTMKKIKKSAKNIAMRVIPLFMVVALLLPLLTW